MQLLFACVTPCQLDVSCKSFSNFFALFCSVLPVCPACLKRTLRLPGCSPFVARYASFHHLHSVCLLTPVTKRAVQRHLNVLPLSLWGVESLLLWPHGSPLLRLRMSFRRRWWLESCMSNCCVGDCLSNTFGLSALTVLIALCQVHVCRFLRSTPLSTFGPLCSGVSGTTGKPKGVSYSHRSTYLPLGTAVGCGASFEC